MHWWDDYVRLRDEVDGGSREAAAALLKRSYLYTEAVNWMLVSKPELLRGPAQRLAAFPMLYSVVNDETQQRINAIKSLGSGSRLGGVVKLRGKTIWMRELGDEFSVRLISEWIPRFDYIGPPDVSGKLPSFPLARRADCWAWAKALVDFYHPPGTLERWDAVDRRAAKKQAVKYRDKRQGRLKKRPEMGTAVDAMTGRSVGAKTKEPTEGDWRAGLMEKVASLLRSIEVD